MPRRVTVDKNGFIVSVESMTEREPPPKPKRGTSSGSRKNEFVWTDPPKYQRVWLSKNKLRKLRRDGIVPTELRPYCDSNGVLPESIMADYL